MDHMRISGTEPSSVILSQICSIKSCKVMTKKCQNKLKPKGMVYKPTKLLFQSILNTEKFDALQTLRINQSRP